MPKVDAKVSDFIEQILGCLGKLEKGSKWKKVRKKWSAKTKPQGKEAQG